MLKALESPQPQQPEAQGQYHHPYMDQWADYQATGHGHGHEYADQWYWEDAA